MPQVQAGPLAGGLSAPKGRSVTDPVAIPTLPRVPLPVTLDEAGVCEFFGVDALHPSDVAQGRIVYIMRDRGCGLVKIGLSVDPGERRYQLGRQFGLDLEMVVVMPGGRIRERLLHQAFDDQRTEHPLLIDGFPAPGLPDEWFECAGPLADALRRAGVA